MWAAYVAAWLALPVVAAVVVDRIERRTERGGW